jgi:hypothetical protein
MIGIIARSPMNRVNTVKIIVRTPKRKNVMKILRKFGMLTLKLHVILSNKSLPSMEALYVENISPILKTN